MYVLLFLHQLLLAFTLPLPIAYSFLLLSEKYPVPGQQACSTNFLQQSVKDFSIQNEEGSLDNFESMRLNLTSPKVNEQELFSELPPPYSARSEQEPVALETKKYQYRALLLEDVLESKTKDLKAANYRVVLLQDALQRRMEELKTLTLEVSSLRETVSQTKEELKLTESEMKEERAKMRNRIDDLSVQLAEAKQALSIEQNSFRKAEKSWTWKEGLLQERIEKFNVRTLLLQDKVLKLTGENDALVQMNSDLLKQVHDAQEALNAETDKVDVLKDNRLKELNAELELVQNNLLIANNRAAEIEDKMSAKIKALELELSSSRQLLEYSQAELENERQAQSVQELGQFQDKMSTDSDRWGAFEIEKKLMEEENFEMKQKLCSLEESLQSVQEQCAHMQNNEVELKHQIADKDKLQHKLDNVLKHQREKDYEIAKLKDLSERHQTEMKAQLQQVDDLKQEAEKYAGQVKALDEYAQGKRKQVKILQQELAEMQNEVLNKESEQVKILQQAHSQNIEIWNHSLRLLTHLSE